mmetsp:Transcript_35058/g.40513  ORF Transcript_35058/g.40513 Transcript_35058/m.40513 type:complete len:214 (+) Transcript_35058:171-812(+)
MEIQKQLEREEQFHQWMNVTEFILERNNDLIKTMEELFSQMTELKENAAVQTSEIDNLKSAIRKKEKIEEQMKEYLLDYEAQIADFKSELKQKDEIIFDLKQDDLTKLGKMQPKYEIPEVQYEDDDEDEDFDFGDNHYDLNGRVSNMIFTSLKENEKLKNNLLSANTRMTEINKQYKQDIEKYEFIEEELRILKTHFYALEKEKAITDQKLKT